MPAVPGSPPAATHVAAESAAVDHLAWETKVTRWGVLGVNLTKSLEALDATELRRLNNAVTRQGGGFITRPGLTTFAFGGTEIHSITILNDPNSATYTYFWGIDGTLQRGQLGALNGISAGFSGAPLCFTPWQSELSGEPWMFVADANKMVKATRTSPALPIGLPKATQPSSVAIAEILRTSIASFDASDNTGPANWTAFHITVGDDAASGQPIAPTFSVIPGPQGDALLLTTDPGAVAIGIPYVSAGSAPKNMDLSILQGGPTVATDDDIVHIWLWLDNPAAIDEIRLYLVCSAFTPALKVLPGMSEFNPSAYMVAFRSSDFARFVAGQESASSAGARVRGSAYLSGYSDPFAQGTARETIDPITGQVVSVPDGTTVPGRTVLPGAKTWLSIGTIGIPVRRGDFVRIGAAGSEGVDWSTITGLCVAVRTNTNEAVGVAFDDCYLTGGGNVDSAEVDAQPFDYRVINIDRRTRAQSNPSDVMTTTIDALRQRVVVQPAAYGDANIYQELYRRGGQLVDNWYGPVATNAVDGAQLVDNTADVEASAAGTLEIDNDQPVTTAEADGDAVFAEPLNFLFGPIDEYLLGGGDRYRPGDLYWCKRGRPDSWPAVNHRPVCPPSETLMNGGMYASQGFVFSRERMYSVQIGIGEGTEVSTSPTNCAHGLIGRMGMAIGVGGIFFVSRDAVRVTQGGESKTISDAIRPLFRGESVAGYFPIDFTEPDAISLAVHGDDLWFGFQDTEGDQVWWIYSIIYDNWRFYSFAVPVRAVYSDQRIETGLRLLAGGVASGQGYTHSGFTDAGVAFTGRARTGALFGETREEKLLGDITFWGNAQGSSLSLQTRLNNDVVENAAQTIGASVLDDRYLFQPFGHQPQHAQTLSLDLSWSSMPAAYPSFHQFGVGIAIQPEITMLRTTTWQSLNPGGESYLTSCWIDCDTFGEDITLVIEGLRNGNLVGVFGPFTINSNAGRRIWRSWPAVKVDMVRIRPADNCAEWMLFGQGWQHRPEPPNIAVWDSGFENLGDTYYTGLDLGVNTGGANKQVQVEVDGVPLADPATGLLYWTINTTGNRLVHLTLPWGRGHIYRFIALDTNLGLLYSHKWYVEAEPSEQHNWNQNFTIAGTLADKWIKGILLECDSFNATKQVNVEVDGIAVPGGPFPVIANGRKVVQIAFPQRLGRVFRIFPADNLPGRLYSVGWLFDEEPYQLTRFETQEQRHGFDEWHLMVYGQITYKANSEVTMTVQVYGQDANLLATHAYSLPATNTQKSMVPLKPNASKGVLYKYIFTSSEGFWLYRDESYIQIQGWTGGATTKVKPFGNDDLDRSRDMRNAVLTASRAGGLADN